jgi:hypothetical protein
VPLVRVATRVRGLTPCAPAVAILRLGGCVLLAVDVGNSNVKVGVFDHGEPVGRWRLEYELDTEPERVAGPFATDTGI